MEKHVLGAFLGNGEGEISLNLFLSIHHLHLCDVQAKLGAALRAVIGSLPRLALLHGQNQVQDNKTLLGSGQALNKNRPTSLTIHVIEIL